MRARRRARVAALQAGWLASQLGAWRRFRRAEADVAGTQRRLLAALVAVLGRSPHGRSLGLDRVQGPDAFRRLPIGDPASHAPWIARVSAGDLTAMSAEPVEAFERTSGTGGAVKLVPYTARLRSEFSEAVGVWMVDLHRALPGLLGTRSYWSVSRATRTAERTSGGVRVGFDEDAEYFDPVTRWALRRLLAVPGHVARAATIEAWRTETALHLLECADLGLISVWSPSFATRLLTWVREHRGELRGRLSSSARRRLDLAGPELDGRALWPRLSLVSAWGDGFAANLVAPMMASFPGVPFQPKGLLATEGVVSVPLWGRPGGALAVTSHLVELREVEGGEVRWAEEARLGERYQPLLTTGGGLVRYALPDIVEVVGFSGQVPCVRLVGRTDKASDLVGEKLTEPFVAEVLARVCGGRGFAMLVPAAEPLGYALVVDRDPPSAEAVEAALRGAYHYAYARDLEQLAPARVVARADAWSRWERAVEASGLVLGGQKPGALEARPAVAEALLSD